MSRISDGDWDDYNWQLSAGRWKRNSETTLRSKRGQTVLRDLEAALVALPVPELIEGQLWTQPTGIALQLAEAYGVDPTPQVCVLGAYAMYKGERYEDYEYLNDEDAGEAADWFSHKLGVAFTLAWNLMELNDDQYARATPRERYDGILAWVRERISGVPR